MTTTRRNLLITLIIISAAVALGWYYASHKRGADGAVGAADSSIPGSLGIDTIGGDATIREISSTELKAPDLTESLTFSADLSAEAQQVLRAQYAALQKTLADAPTDFNALAQLGVIRKMAGDYNGAAEVWIYASQLYPTNVVTFGNLGNLYMDFVKDYPKSEAYLKKAIANNAQDTNAFRALFSLYSDYGYKAQSDGVAVLKQGISANPAAIDLRVTLARYYVKTGEGVSAKAQYDAAIVAAQDAGNTEIAAQLTQEKKDAGL